MYRKAFKSPLRFHCTSIQSTYMSGFHLENFIRGGSSVIIMKGGHDQMKSRCGFYSKLEYCEGVAEEFGGEVGELGGKLPPHFPQ